MVNAVSLMLWFASLMTLPLWAEASFEGILKQVFSPAALRSGGKYALLFLHPQKAWGSNGPFFILLDTELDLTGWLNQRLEVEGEIDRVAAAPYGNIAIVKPKSMR